MILRYNHQCRALSAATHWQLTLSPDAPTDRIRLRVLLTPHNRLTPLFRYCWGKRHAIQPVIDRYERDAVCDYSRAPEVYDQVWKDLIPPRLREATEKLRRQQAAVVNGRTR
jgi:hypothetical protein